MPDQWAMQFSDDDPVLHNFRILKQYVLDDCASCHDPFGHDEKIHDDRSDLLRLVNYRQWVVPGKPADSKLWLRIKDGKSGRRMPVNKPLQPVFIELIEKWIGQMPAGS